MFERASSFNIQRLFMYHTQMGMLRVRNTSWTAMYRMWVRAHSLFWDVEKNVPDWVKAIATKAELKSVLDSHIQYMMSLTKGKYVARPPEHHHQHLLLPSFSSFIIIVVIVLVIILSLIHI